MVTKVISVKDAICMSVKEVVQLKVSELVNQEFMRDRRYDELVCAWLKLAVGGEDAKYMDYTISIYERACTYGKSKYNVFAFERGLVTYFKNVIIPELRSTVDKVCKDRVGTLADEMECNAVKSEIMKQLDELEKSTWDWPSFYTIRPYSCTEEISLQNVVVNIIENIFNVEGEPRYWLRAKVLERLHKLSSLARLFAVVLYLDRKIVQQGRLLYWDYDIADIFEPTVRILLNVRSESVRDELRKAVDELIYSGLLVCSISRSKRHAYYNYVVPSFIRDLWDELPKYISIEPEVKCKLKCLGYSELA